MTLILGGSGQLGSAIARLIPDAAIPSRSELDLAQTSVIRTKVARFKPDRIINCAAYTDVEAAERNQEEATLVNAMAVGELAAAAHDLDVPFTTVSSDYVFDGMSNRPYVESSVPNPINAYGLSKLAGEELALAYNRSLVIRTSWLISVTHPNFLTNILDRIRIGPIEIVDDQWGTPTLVPDLAMGILDAHRHDTTGMLHLAGEPTTTWWGLARAAVEAAGMDSESVARCSTDELQRSVSRPAFSALTSERMHLFGLRPLPRWGLGLPRMVKEW